MTDNAGTPRRSQYRTLFRVLGIVCMGIALALIGLALADFVSVMNSDNMDAQPTKFWYFFVALPFFLVGGFCLQAGFLGAAARFAADETMPVVKDLANQFSEGRGSSGSGATGPFCSKCGVRNDDAAKFCDSCGAALG